MSNTETILSRITAVRGFLVVLSLLSALVVSFMMPSTADAIGGCPANHVCLYQNKEFGGNSLAVGAPSGCYTLVVLAGQATSVVNNTASDIRYYDNSTCEDTLCWLHDGFGGYRRDLTLDRYSNYCYELGKGAPNNDILSFRLF